MIETDSDDYRLYTVEIYSGHKRVKKHCVRSRTHDEAIRIAALHEVEAWGLVGGMLSDFGSSDQMYPEDAVRVQITAWIGHEDDEDHEELFTYREKIAGSPTMLMGPKVKKVPFS